MEDVPILINGEELPTNEKVRYLTVEILSQEERKRLEELRNKLETVIESGALTPEISTKIAMIFESLQKIAEAIDRIKRPYDMDVVVEDVKNRFSSMSEELENLSLTVSKKVDSSIQRLDSRSETISDAATSIGFVKNDLESAISSLESYSRTMENRLLSLSENLKTFISAFDKKLDDISKVAGSLEVTKEEVDISLGNAIDRLDSHEKLLSDSVSSIDASSKDLSSLDSSVKESNVKMSILIDSLEQRVSELSSIFENVKNIENGIESQMNSMKNIADFIREFIAHAEDSSGKLDSAVIGMTAFNERINDEMRSLLDTMEEKTGYINEASKELASLKSQIESHLEDVDAMKSDISETVYALNKTMPLMEKTTSDVSDINSLVSTAVDRLERSLETLETIQKNAERSYTDHSKFLEELKETREAAVKSFAYMEDAGSKLNSTALAVDKKTDDILNVILGKSRDLESISDSLEKTAGAIQTSADKLDRVLDKLNIDKLKIRRAKPARSSRKKTTMSRRTRRKSKPRRIRARQLRAGIRRNVAVENEALDLLILNTLNNVSMNITTLSNTTRVSETRLRNRLNILISRGVIARERRGRSIFYVSRVDQATEEMTG